MTRAELAVEFAKIMYPALGMIDRPTAAIIVRSADSVLDMLNEGPQEVAKLADVKFKELQAQARQMQAAAALSGQGGPRLVR